MNTWLKVAASLVSVGITVIISFFSGRYVGECQANFKFSGMYTGMLKDLGKESAENWEKKRLIELMKRSGRRKRDECRKLKKQASLMQFVAKETAESNAIVFSRMIALRNALGEIYVQCSKNAWQQKRVRHILKKYGVIRCRKS